jgi:Sulfotransferase family
VWTERTRVVFLLGVPRSGTTWLQNMLGAHPDIATPTETDLFNRYIAPLHSAWSQSFRSPDEVFRRWNGLPAVLTQEDFDDVVEAFVERVYSTARALKPTATVVLDKVPGYTQYGGLIDAYVPGALFVHLIRDGRDVTASMYRAAQTFGRLWAPRTADYAGYIWQSNIRTARLLEPAGRYFEVRYEDLRSEQGASVLRDVFHFLGRETSLDEAHEIHETFSDPRTLEARSSMVWGGELVRRFGGAPPEPEGFVGEGTIGSWHRELSSYDRWLFDRHAGDLLLELGYEADRGWVRPGMWRLLGPTRFYLVRWRGLLRNTAAKIRRNLRAQPYQSRADAVPMPFSRP